jgi:hypothetical protein
MGGKMRIFAFCLFVACGVYANPTVSNIRVSQRENTKLVDIYYDVSYTGGDTVAISCEVSTNAGVSYDVAASSFSGDYGAVVSNGTDRLIVWNAGVDWDENYSEQMMLRITAAAPRFSVIDQDYVMDNKTGLLWLKSYSEGSGSYYSALTGATERSVTMEGVTKTVTPRLPTYDELQALADDDTVSGLPYGHPFTISSGVYWTSSIYYAPTWNSSDSLMWIEGFSFYNRDGTGSGSSSTYIKVDVIPIDINENYGGVMYVIDEY